MTEDRKKYFRDYYNNHKEKIKIRRKKEWNQSYYDHHKEKCNKKNLQRYYAYRDQWRIWFHENQLDICNICGYNKSFYAIDFHHTNPMLKEKNVGYFLRLSPSLLNIQKALNEIIKTQVLCSNCHRELHAEEK